MAVAVENHFSGDLSGIAVTRYQHGLPTRQIEVVEAGHPVPDEAGEKAARRMLEQAKKLGPDHGVMHGDLADKFKCSICGSKRVTIRVVPYANKPQATVSAWTGKERRARNA